MISKQNVYDYLSGNVYPGRGVLIGRSADGACAVSAYFIMGRSTNSRNRIFIEDGAGIRTEAYDPALLSDPSLIIYAPVRVYGNTTEGKRKAAKELGISLSSLYAKLGK